MQILASTSAVALLSACGGSGYDANIVTNPNVSPVHGGDIAITMGEKDEFRFVHLLGTPAGESSGDGIAIDANGDELFISNVQSSLSDMTGFELLGPRLGVRPSALIDELDTGTQRVLTLNYEVSDGIASVSRTATITIEGEDFAPEFEPVVTEVLSKFAETTVIDLLAGVVDRDEEPLTAASVVLPDNAPQGLFSLENNLLTVNVPVIADSIAIGDNRAFDITYKVEDHNNSLPRKLTVDIRGVRLEPVAPIVYTPQTVVGETAGSRVSIKLTAEPAIVDENGDALSVDFSTISPRSDAPAFSFDLSDKDTSTLVFDPMRFAPHLTPDSVKTFIYDYDVSDGEFVVPASIEITITHNGSEQALQNGGFEDGFTGWSNDAGNTQVASGASETGMQVEGSNYLDFTGVDTVKRNLSNLTLGASYVLEMRLGQNDPWGGATMLRVYGEVEGEADTLLTSVQMYGHGVKDRSFAAMFTAMPNTYFTVEAAQPVVDADDFRLYRVDFDQTNNLIGEINSTFDQGVGDWVLGNGVSHTMEGLDGTGSLVSGSVGDVRSVLNLGTNTIESGKRYLVTMDVERESDDGAHTFRVSLVDSANEGSNVTVAGGAFSGVYWLSNTRQKFASVLDTSRYTDIADWQDRDVALHIGTNVWGQGNGYTIDNIRIIELP